MFPFKEKHTKAMRFDLKLSRFIYCIRQYKTIIQNVSTMYTILGPWVGFLKQKKRSSPLPMANKVGLKTEQISI